MHVNYSIWWWVGASNNDPAQGLHTLKSSPVVKSARCDAVTAVVYFRTSTTTTVTCVLSTGGCLFTRPPRPAEPCSPPSRRASSTSARRRTRRRRGRRRPAPRSRRRRSRCGRGRRSARWRRARGGRACCSSISASTTRSAARSGLLTFCISALPVLNDCALYTYPRTHSLTH